MKDVSKQTLQNLLTFIYRGEVKVNRDDLNEFITIANSLKIKGLADDNFDLSFNFPAAKPSSSKPFQYQSSQMARSIPLAVNSEPASPNYYQHSSSDHEQHDNFDNGNTNQVTEIGYELDNNYDDDYQCYGTGEDNSTMDQKFNVPSGNHHDSGADDKQLVFIATNAKRVKRAAPRKHS